MEKKEKDGRSTLTIKNRVLRKLFLYKRAVGYKSLSDLIEDMMAKEDLLSYLVDLHPDTSFDLTPQQKKQYETEHNIRPIGVVEATYLKPKVKPRSNKILIVPKDIEVVKR